MVVARDEGLVRWIGITGHGFRIAGMHLRSLERFDFDSVLFPLSHSVMGDVDYRRDVEALVEVCTERNVAMQTIKSIARRRWPNDAEGPKLSWYQPVRDVDGIDRAVRYVLGSGPFFLNTSSDATLLPPILESESRASGERPGEDELRADEDRFGITPLFDWGELERI